MLSFTPAKEEAIGVIDRAKFAESLKEILMSCDDVRTNTDWFDAVLYAYGVLSGYWYLPNDIPSTPNIGEIGITWRGPSDGPYNPVFGVDVGTGIKPLNIATKSTDKFDPDMTTTATPITREINNGF